MKATPKNMRALAKKQGEAISARGVFSLCPVCGHESSASAGDYFMMRDTQALICNGGGEHEGAEMVLATRSSSINLID